MKRDWLQPGSEPSISELLDDPTTHTIMRHDGLKAEQIWKVVDKAKRKLVLSAAKRDRREKEEAKQRSIRDDPGLPTAKDLNPIDSLGEWPDMLGVAALQRPDLTCGSLGRSTQASGTAAILISLSLAG